MTLRIEDFTKVDPETLRRDAWRRFAPVLRESLAPIADAYATLEISPNVPISRDQIQENYRRLVRQYHPDRNFAAEAEGAFIKVQDAYDLLTKKDMHRQVEAIVEGLAGTAAQRLEGHFQRYAATGGWKDALYRSGQPVTSFPVDHLQDEKKQALIGALEQAGYKAEVRYSRSIGGMVVTVEAEPGSTVRGADVSRRLKARLAGGALTGALGHAQGEHQLVRPQGAEESAARPENAPGHGEAPARAPAHGHRKPIVSPPTDADGRALGYREVPPATVPPLAPASAEAAASHRIPLPLVEPPPAPPGAAPAAAADPVPATPAKPVSTSAPSAPAAAGTHPPAGGSGLTAAESGAVRNLERAEQDAVRAGGKPGKVVAGVAIAAGAALALWALLKPKLRRKGEAPAGTNDRGEKATVYRNPDPGLGEDAGSMAGGADKSWTATVASSPPGIGGWTR